VALSIQAKVLARAALISGGTNLLSRTLNVDESSVVAWIRGNAVAPLPLFLRAIDLTLAHDCRALGEAEATRRLADDLASHSNDDAMAPQAWNTRLRRAG
jgi:hypothetical protein